MRKGKLGYVPTELCFHSPFNTRKTRDTKQIERLAERIHKFGFEETRALWVRPVDGRYEVFAGGMRLEAANLADVSPTIPVIPHHNCLDDEVAFLAEYDNENDEYHTPVSPVDIWEEYARLKSLSWTQQRIAKSKGVDRSTVAQRLKFHQVSDKVKGFVTSGLLSEFHLREITGLLPGNNLRPWLTTSRVWEELAQKAVNDRAKNGSKSREAVKKDAENWQQFITYAEQVFASLPEEQTLYDLSCEPPTPHTYWPREQFIKLLAERSVRSLPKVKVEQKKVRDFIANELLRYGKYVELKSTQAAKQGILPKDLNNGHNVLSTVTNSRYLVVCQAVEKFQPPDEITFPLITADPPWNISDPGHKRERKVRPRPFTKDFGPWDNFKTNRAYLTKCRQWLQNLYEVAAPDAWLFITMSIYLILRMFIPRLIKLV